MKWQYQLTWWFLRFCFTIYFRWRIQGADNVPASGPVILASNHASFLDPPLVGCATNREASYLARESLFDVPVLGTIIRIINALPVDREGKSPKGLKAILDRLAEGWPIVLFPEGTRTSDGSLLPARAGVGLAVIKSRAPVVPVRIIGSFEAYSREMKFPRPRKITVVFGQPMTFEDEIATVQSGDKAQVKATYAAVANRIMDAIGHLDVAKR